MNLQRITLYLTPGQDLRSASTLTFSGKKHPLNEDHTKTDEQSMGVLPQSGTGYPFVKNVKEINITY